MSAKPATLPRWADVGGAIVTPAAGKLNVGYVPGERPPAQYKNWLQYWNYKWIEYLNDGALQGAHTFNSTVGISGLLTSAAITASGLVTANAGVTAGANQHVTVSGTGRYKHGTLTKLYSPQGLLLAQSGSGVVTYNDSGAADYQTIITCTAQPLGHAMRLDGFVNGQRIINLRAYLKDVSGQPAVTVAMRIGDRAGSSAVHATTGTSAASGATQTITLASLNHIVGTSLVGPIFMRLSTGSNATGAYELYAVEVDYDWP